MSITTVRDVLEHANRFERMIAEYYEDIEKHSSREGVRLLCHYMSRHADRIREMCEKLPPKQFKRLAAHPVRYEPSGADRHSLENMSLDADAPSEEVLDAAIQLDECLVDLFKQVERQTNDEEIAGFFKSLIASEISDEKRLKKIKAMHYF